MASRDHNIQCRFLRRQMLLTIAFLRLRTRRHSQLDGFKRKMRQTKYEKTKTNKQKKK